MDFGFGFMLKICRDILILFCLNTEPSWTFEVVFGIDILDADKRQPPLSMQGFGRKNSFEMSIGIRGRKYNLGNSAGI